MSSKADLQRKLSEIGYEIGPFASKDTLSNVIRLHLLVRKFISLWFLLIIFIHQVLQNKGVDVAKLNDLDIRKNLTENGYPVGPVTSKKNQNLFY